MAAAARNKVLVLNAGSSSLKYKLFELLGDGAATLKPIASGNCERIGDPSSSFMKVGRRRRCAAAVPPPPPQQCRRLPPLSPLAAACHPPRPCMPPAARTVLHRRPRARASRRCRCRRRCPTTPPRCASSRSSSATRFRRSVCVRVWRGAVMWGCVGGHTVERRCGAGSDTTQQWCGCVSIGWCACDVGPPSHPPTSHLHPHLRPLAAIAAAAAASAALHAGGGGRGAPRGARPRDQPARAHHVRLVPPPARMPCPACTPRLLHMTRKFTCV